MTAAPLHTEQDTLPTLLFYIRETVAILWKDWPTDMKVNLVSKQNHTFSMSGPCPHCGLPSVFVEVTSKYILETDRNGFSTVAGVMQCQGCMKPILGVIRYFSNGENSSYVAHYPIGKPNDAVDRAIPQAIANDFKEALRCFWVDAYNATAEMCRRAVEASCIQLGAPKKAKWLDDKIDWLEAQRKITPFLKDVAHKIRLGGNRAAHPPHIDPETNITNQQDPDTPVEEVEPPISQEHAAAIITFTREFFHHIYVVPTQLDKYDFSKPKSKGQS